MVGDSLCAFNPVYGQGMTVAAKEVERLAATLAGCAGPDRLVDVVRRAQREVARCTDGPWTLATSNDLRFPGTDGGRLTVATRVINRYLDRVTGARARIATRGWNRACGGSIMLSTRRNAALTVASSDTAPITRSR